MSNTFSDNPVIDINQSKLQDFIDCPRRFQLGSIQENPWPAANSLPIDSAEKLILIGNRFHQAAQQFFLGIPEKNIRNAMFDPELLDMFAEFRQFAHNFLSNRFYAEQLIQVPFQGYRLIAKFDLIVHIDGKFLIIDWKTSNKKPLPSELAKRMQTNLYPFIFNLAGSDLFDDQQINPDLIQFMYWFPLCSEHETLFAYSSEKDIDFEIELTGILDKITDFQKNKDIFPLTSDQRLCTFCGFRSLCERGDQVGSVADLVDFGNEEYQDFIFDLEQITELEF